jgi:hypothetical protein
VPRKPMTDFGEEEEYHDAREEDDEEGVEAEKDAEEEEGEEDEEEDDSSVSSDEEGCTHVSDALGARPPKKDISMEEGGEEEEEEEEEEDDDVAHEKEAERVLREDAAALELEATDLEEALRTDPCSRPPPDPTDPDSRCRQIPHKDPSVPDRLRLTLAGGVWFLEDMACGQVARLPAELREANLMVQ